MGMPIEAARESLAMHYVIVPVTPFEQNCTIVWCAETMRGAIVDPGGDVDRVLRAAHENRVVVEKILLTHGHVDHAGGVAELVERLRVPVEGPHPADKFWLDGMAQQCRVFGLPVMPAFAPDRWLATGEQVRVGNLTFQVKHCPGHTPGHVIFFNDKARLALVGDVLFAGSIGRTDFPGGDYDTLIRSIRDKLLPLGDGVAFIPGHGPMSTFGEERRTNPFVTDRSAGWRSRL
jgi:glyoxylase-like metal-dependent hydrolase (beta-lactamase superfamily II)